MVSGHIPSIVPASVLSPAKYWRTINNQLLICCEKWRVIDDLLVKITKYAGFSKVSKPENGFPRRSSVICQQLPRASRVFTAYLGKTRLRKDQGSRITVIINERVWKERRGLRK